LVKPNRGELAATVQRSLLSESDVIEAMREVSSRGARRVVVTAGKEPVVALDGEHIWKIHSPKIRPVNPIGSGDAFTAGLVWRLLLNENLDECCRWAVATGAANALGLMPGELDKTDVERLAAEVRVERL
jgi:fructose-1-phosphate kinase PfkB-like protein